LKGRDERNDSQEIKQGRRQEKSRVSALSGARYGRRLMDNYPYAFNVRLKPIAASGYIWIPLEQDKDRIVSKYYEG